MLAKTAIALLIAGTGVATVGLIVPDGAKVERRITIGAPKERVLPLAATMLGCGPGHVSPAAGCAILADGLRRTVGDGALADDGRSFPGGMAKIELHETASGVLAVLSYSTKLRAFAPLWAKPFAAYRGLTLQHDVGAAFERRLRMLKAEAEKA